MRVDSYAFGCFYCNIFADQVAESAAPRAGGNVIVSPLAAAATLAMLLELEDAEGSSSGAKAAQDLRRALRLPKADIGAGDSLRLGFHALLGLSRTLESQEDVAGAFASAVLRTGVNGELPTKAKESLRKYFWANITKETRTGGDSLELSVDAGILSHWRDIQLLPVYVVLSHRAAAPFQRGPDAGGEVAVPMVPLVGEYRLGAVKLDGFACKIVEVPLEVSFFTFFRDRDRNNMRDVIFTRLLLENGLRAHRPIFGSGSSWRFQK